MTKIDVFTDGSATVAAKPGGYGYVLVVDGAKIFEGNGYMDRATNNDAEMQAAIAGLASALKYVSGRKELNPTFKCKVTLCSDSQIILNWANGTNRFKQESKLDKFRQLSSLMKRLNADTRWVRGHSGDEHNERCDVLANLGRLGLKPEDKLPTKKSHKKEKVSKIGQRTDNIIVIQLNDKIKILDFVKNICEDYSEEIHGKRKLDWERHK